MTIFPELTRYLLRKTRLSALPEVEMTIQSLTTSKLRALLAALKEAAAKGEIRNYPNSALIAIIFGPCREVVRL